MRMWMIKPSFLCRKHLLGEHGEIHKFLPSFSKGLSIEGRMSPVIQIQLNALKSRHDLLAEEMLRRGYNHKSPIHSLPNLATIYPEHFDKIVDPIISAKDLSSRCRDCFERLDPIFDQWDDYMSLIKGENQCEFTRTR